jgi:hypothetical protein
MTLTATLGSVAGVSIAMLWGVSVAGWNRTRRVRRGSLGSPAPPTSVPGRTSLTTFLPGVAGILVVLTGLAGVVDGMGGWTIWLAVVGAPIAAAAFIARVTRLEPSTDRLVVRYRARPPFTVAWNECRGLIPPRWPLGGWRVDGPHESRILMASDLLGQEDVLRRVIAAADLRFVDGAWRRTAT